MPEAVLYIFMFPVIHKHFIDALFDKNSTFLNCSTLVSAEIVQPPSVLATKINCHNFITGETITAQHTRCCCSSASVNGNLPDQ